MLKNALKSMGRRWPRQQTIRDCSYLAKLAEPSTEDLVKLSKTSATLYRIMLKSLRASNHGPIENQIAGHENSNYIMLQPPLDRRDYGSARIMDAEKCVYWCDGKPAGEEFPSEEKAEREKQILSFFNWWVQYFNESFGNERVDSFIIQELDLVSIESLLEKSIFVSYNDLKQTLRKGFRLFSGEALDKPDILQLQRFAMESIKLMEDQRDAWERTSISVDSERGLRVIATSRYVSSC